MPLSFRFTALLVVASFVGLDLWTRDAYRTTQGLRDRVQAFAESADPRQSLVIIGTCLPQQLIRADVLASTLGLPVQNLGTPATSPLDWHLAFQNGLPHDRVRALVIAFGRADLQSRISPYESHVMELAGAADVPELLTEVCGADTECAVDLALRWAWPTWRYRVRIANRVWRGLDALPVESPAMPAPRPYDGAGLRYLRRLLHAARAEDIPVWMVPLPTRPGSSDRRPAIQPAEAALLTAEGVELVYPTALDAGYFTDDVHLTVPGTVTFTQDLAETLRPRLERSAEVDRRER